MFKRKPEIDAAVARVFDAMRSLYRGDVMLHEDVESLAKCKRGEEFWNSLIAKLKRRMQEERGITIWARAGVGYKLLTVKEQLVMQNEKRARRATKQLSMGVNSLLALPTEELSHHQQITRAVKAQDGIRARRLIKRQLKQQQREAEPRETTPQVNAFRRPKKPEQEEVG